MNIRIALCTGLMLTLGTAMSALAIQTGPSAKSTDAVAKAVDQQTATVVTTTSQVTPASSRILLLPRPL